jgi:tetratricopeptide (TPR) repeat protein
VFSWDENTTKIGYFWFMNRARFFICWLIIAGTTGCHNTGNKAAPAEKEQADSISGITEMKAALEDIDQVLRHDSANYEAWLQKGNLLASLRDTIQAIRALEISFAIYPLINTGLTLANLYAETKNERAIGLCNAMLAKDSAQELTDALYIKGIYYSRVNDVPMAVQQYDSCIIRDWKFIDAYIDKGILLYTTGNISEALHTFQLAATVSNTYPDAYFWIGRCLEAQGKIKDAQENYRKAVALDPSFTEAKARIP